MAIRVGIVGISGFGGGEALRLLANHPSFELVYAAGHQTAGQKLVDIFPGITSSLEHTVIESWTPERLPELDLLFASLPTGSSAKALARVPKKTRIVDIGGDHRYAADWTYGMADLWPSDILGQSRVANPGCFPAATQITLAPLLKSKLIQSENIIVDAKTGISGAGRGGGGGFSYADCNENIIPYGLLNHVHLPEMKKTIERLSGGSASGLVFTPHLVPMTRGIVVTTYCRGDATTEQCIEAARSFYRESEFVRVTNQPPQSKWASGSNMAFVSYAADPSRNLVIGMGVVDNLGKGAAGHAVQNANLMFGLPAGEGLGGMPLWP